MAGTRTRPRVGAAEQAGRLLMIGWEGQDPSEAISLVEELHPAGLVFFKRNYPGSYGSLKKILRAITGSAEKILGRPILMALDHEGGAVNRLPLEETMIPSARRLSEIAASEGPGRIMDISYRAAKALRDLGFNFNLAPVLDLGGDGAYIGERSYGRDPDLAARAAGAFWEGHFKAGVMTCGKHFPGLGSSIVDPHADLPVVIKPVQELWDEDGRPFRELISLGVAAVMTTPALYRSVDPHLPATFSQKVTGMLKGEYAFKGPVLTDDLEMGALRGIFPPGEAALRAVNAGHDLALVCQSAENIRSAGERLKRAVVDMEITPTRLREALLRLRKLMRQVE